MDRDVERLVKAMDALAAFLRERGHDHWADWVATDAARLRRGDGRGATHFLAAFGGMGSLNDLLFSPVNQTAETHQEAALLNARFRHLLDTAWREADALRRHADA